MEITLEIGDGGCGRLEFELPLDATDEDGAYIESLVPRIESGLLELRDPSTDEVVLGCRPSLTGESAVEDCNRKRGEAKALKQSPARGRALSASSVTP